VGADFGCRKNYNILLTDGAPNMDLRPACSGPSGADSPPCPFQRPDDIARDLASGGNGTRPIVKTFVIGFAVTEYLDNGTGVVRQCSALTNPPQDCQSPDPNFIACCNLQKIAEAGGTGRAYFAETQGDLQAALDAITSAIASESTTRTTPAYSPVLSGVGASTSSNVFLSSFFPNPRGAWSGNIQRRAWKCTQPSATDPFDVVQPDLNVSEGDDFAANLNLPGTAPTRQFIAIKPAGTVTENTARGFVRPYVDASVADGLGQQLIEEVGTSPDAVVSALTASGTVDLFGASSTSCLNRSGTNPLTQAKCAERALRYAMAQPTMVLPSDHARFKDRSDNALGDIFRATPAVVAPASSLLRDDSYQAFRSLILPNYRAVADAINQPADASLSVRNPIFVYAPTNDGLLHSFMGSVTRNVNNEAWAMLIPAVLPTLKSAYNTRVAQLDGPPTVKDVVWRRSRTTLGDAAAARSAWHTMLVAGTGNSGAYYAVDVSDPNIANWSPSTTTGGPRFRWQLGRLFDAGGTPSAKQLFGTFTGSPAITTVFIDGPTAGDPPVEVGVAILPGGSDGPTASTSSACDRLGLVSGNTTALPVAGYDARTQVRCWGAVPTQAAPVNGRSLVVVRIDTGEILRVFTRDLDAPGASDRPPQIARSLVTHTPLDSPITGTPVVFPSDVGAVAQKVYVGDADGTMWRFDISSRNPAEWRGEIFFDAYGPTTLGAAQAQSAVPLPAGWAASQPVMVPPVLALGPTGSTLLAYSTGTTDEFTPTGTHFVLSLSETIAELSGVTKPRAQVRWFLPLLEGDRVSGPMTIFDDVLYFSTFKATALTAACSAGEARLYGRDYFNARTPTVGDPNLPSAGGEFRLKADAFSADPPPPFVVSTDVAGSGSRGRVIPGVSINVTPTCAGIDAIPVNDPTLGMARFEATQMQPGKYSLFASMGGRSVNGTQSSTASINVDLPTPRAATRVTSWANVVE
jgi:type IV pilus assembly protein PilY1